MPHVFVLRTAARAAIAHAGRRAVEVASRRDSRGVDAGDLPTSGPIIPPGSIDDFGDLPL